MQIARVVRHATARFPHGDGPDLPVNSAQHGYLAEPALTGPVPRDVQQHLSPLSVVSED